MKVLNFYNVKGGSGKSSLAYLAGSYLAMKGKRILFMDLDPQCSLTSVFSDGNKGSIYSFLSENYPLTDFIIEHSDLIHYIPSSLNLFKIQDRVLQTKLDKAFKKLNYDFIIIDNSPNYSALSVSSVHASDVLFLPSQLSRFDYDSLVFTVSQAVEIKEDLDIRIIFNRVGKAVTKEEILMSQSEDIAKYSQYRFQNFNGIRKLIAKRDSLELPRNEKIRSALGFILEGIA